MQKKPSCKLSLTWQSWWLKFCFRNSYLLIGFKLTESSTRFEIENFLKASFKSQLERRRPVGQTCDRWVREAERHQRTSTRRNRWYLWYLWVPFAHQRCDVHFLPHSQHLSWQLGSVFVLIHLPVEESKKLVSLKVQMVSFQSTLVCYQNQQMKNQHDLKKESKIHQLWCLKTENLELPWESSCAEHKKKTDRKPYKKCPLKGVKAGLSGLLQQL